MPPKALGGVPNCEPKLEFQKLIADEDLCSFKLRRNLLGISVGQVEDLSGHYLNHLTGWFVGASQVNFVTQVARSVFGSGFGSNAFQGF